VVVFPKTIAEVVFDQVEVVLEFTIALEVFPETTTVEFNHVIVVVFALVVFPEIEVVFNRIVLALAFAVAVEFPNTVSVVLELLGFVTVFPVIKSVEFGHVVPVVFTLSVQMVVFPDKTVVVSLLDHAVLILAFTIVKVVFPETIVLGNAEVEVFMALVVFL